MQIAGMATWCFGSSLLATTMPAPTADPVTVTCGAFPPETTHTRQKVKRVRFR
jgi:hypothetical protein